MVWKPIKQRIRFLVLVKWRKSSKWNSIVMVIFIILSESTDRKLLVNHHFSWDQASTMPLSMLFIKQDKLNRSDFKSSLFRSSKLITRLNDKYFEIWKVAKRHGTNYWHEFAVNMCQNIQCTEWRERKRKRSCLLTFTKLMSKNDYLHVGQIKYNLYNWH